MHKAYAIAGMALAAGIPLWTVSYRAGHAQTSTTSNIYSHAIRTADEKAAEVLDDIVKGKSTIIDFAKTRI